MKPIFSVVMPAYNAERFVGEEIESVFVIAFVGFR
jgi:glycosyltransferase involved in cell wall biosynthesis